jgi:hypothetical protein
MGFFDKEKERAINDAKNGKTKKGKSPENMSMRELERKINSSSSIVEQAIYAEEKLRREGKM